MAVSGGVRTAAVLFTDLSGSTSLRARVGEVEAERLRLAHDGVVRRAIEGAGGTVVGVLACGRLAPELALDAPSSSNNDVPRVIDVLQSETAEGPCIDAITEHEVFMTGDLAAERRWPAFAPRAHEETGVSSILSLRLFVEQDTMGR